MSDTMFNEREALDRIRATATRGVPNCINLAAIDRILADTTPAAALSPTTEEPSQPFAQLKQAATKRLDEFFAGQPGYRLVVDHYLRALEQEVKILAGSVGYTYPAPIPFPVFAPREEMEQYYVTSEQHPTPHLLMWGDGENEAEWCEWDGSAYESSRETVTGFWPKPKESSPAVSATTGEGQGQQWVAVGDGLPQPEPGYTEFSPWVLAYTTAGNMLQASYYFKEDLKGWHTTTGKADVTHWMPLPTAPTAQPHV